MFNNTTFSLALTVASYYLAQKVAARVRHPLANPSLMAAVMVFALLKWGGFSLEAYGQGSQFITYLIGPATVALGISLYRQWSNVKANALAVLVGVAVGSLTGVVSVIVLARAFGGSETIALTLAPKSVTTPIALELSRLIGGVPPLTVIAVMITGLLGAVLGPELLRLCKVKNPLAVGVALGTAAHALGTARATQEGEATGAMAGLSMGLAGIITAVILPLLIKLLL